jgi:WD40 repeat protein
MTLETLGKAATDSMHASATGGLDVEAGLVTLKRTRTRRRHAKVAALVAAVALLGWLAVAPGVGNRPQPAGHHPEPFPHSNGAIVGVRDGNPTVLSEPAGSPPIDLGDLPPLEVRPSTYSWAPDGAELAYTTPTEVRILDVRRGDSRRLLRCHSCQAAWSPRGDVIAVVDLPDLRLVSAGNGSTLVSIATPGISALSWPSWSPDGTQLAFTGFDDARGTGSYSGSGLYRVDADGGHLSRLWAARPGEDARAWASAWSPDGSVIAFAEQAPQGSSFRKGGESVLDDLSIVMIEPDGSARTTVADIGPCLCVGGPSLAWSPDGNLLAFTGRAGRSNGLYAMRADGTGLRRMATGVSGPLAWQPVP